MQYLLQRGVRGPRPMLRPLQASLAVLLLTLGSAASAQAGALDPDFGTGGVVQRLGNRAGSMLLRSSDGSYYLGGYTRDGSMGHLALNRFLADGSIDNAYGNNGTALSFSFNPNAPPTFEAGLALDNGKLMIVGGRVIGDDRSLQLHRINADGSVDASFSAVDPAPGKFCYGTALHRLADGKLLIAAILDRGSNPGSDTNFAVMRYLDDGTLDASFGIGGIAETSFTTGQDRPFALALQSDGAIVLAGWAPIGNGSGFAVARFTADGMLDSSFGNGGRLTPFVASGIEYAHAVAVQPDDRILVAGSTSTNGSSHAIVRLTAAGTLDTDFGNGGRVVYRIGMRSEAKSLSVAGDGSIYTGGYAFDVDDSEYFAVSRISSAGTWDQNFGGSGRVAAAFRAAVVNRHLLQEDGKFVVGGTWADAKGVAGIGMMRVLTSTASLFSDGFETP
ncbi:MAG: hypothetical protein SGI99_14645 [Pseudomonadota bacterium]|nr:hypothetical protein [Pseudomonadota bacterium]